jgi:DNA-binding transcriptional ArsR family regulator
MKELSDALVHKVAERFAALADPHRIRLLNRLREGACSVGALADTVGLAQPSASKHLATLKRVGLVSSERKGTTVYYAVADPAIYTLCELMCDGVSRHLRRTAEEFQNALASMGTSSSGRAQRKRPAKS